MLNTIGLDFGTTNSALAVAGRDRVVKLAPFGGNSTFRSILYFEQDQTSPSGGLRVVGGPDAIHAYLNAKTPGRLIQSTKSYLASRLFTRTQIFGHTFSLEELIGILLRNLRKSAETWLGDLSQSLVVGRPVHFSGANEMADDEFALDRLRAALRLAGFDDVQFLPEPVAAAYKYRQRLDHDELALVADFGGGTSDFSLVRLKAHRHAGDFEDPVVGSDGIGIAGDTFDSKLVRRLVAPMLGLGSQYRSQFGKVLPVPNWLYEHLERWHYLSFLKTRKNMSLLRQIRFQALQPQTIDAFIDLVDHDLGYRLYESIEATKCALSEVADTRFLFAESAIKIDHGLSRDEFDQWIKSEVAAISGCIDRLITKCGVVPKDIDAVFMTGGTSFVPAIRSMFAQKFGASVPIHNGDEFTSVAEGLALYAMELLD